MTVVGLDGCRAKPLLSYLQALGILRLLHEQRTGGLVSFLGRRHTPHRQ